MEMIVAVNKYGIIGKNNKLLWNLPEDMRNFRRLTMHNIVIMGRNTYDSLPCHGLPSRINVVITREPKTKKSENASVLFCTLEECEEKLKKMLEKSDKKVFVIGGSDIYEIFYKRCKKIHITMVENELMDGISIYPLLCEIQETYNLKCVTAKCDDVCEEYEFQTYVRE
jgi:dihydrofolate reductase